MREGAQDRSAETLEGVITAGQVTGLVGGLLIVVGGIVATVNSHTRGIGLALIGGGPVLAVMCVLISCWARAWLRRTASSPMSGNDDQQ
jgi:hypothetical protein